jgi:guanidinobutyrase / D-arginase
MSDPKRAEGPVDARIVPRFAGPSTFARLPRIDEVASYEVAIVGIPFDSGTTYRPGARFGPQAIRAGSKLLRPYHPHLDVEPFHSQQVVDAGDIAFNPFDICDAIVSIEEAVHLLLADGGKVVGLGGDHTVALPMLRAVNRAHGPVALLHFDAHLDTWDTYFGAPYTHGTPFRRASEEGLFIPDRSTHVGIRGPLYAREDLTEDEAMGFGIIGTWETDSIGVEGVIEKVRCRIGDTPLYVSIDIDVLDPAFAPGTGTPEIGGFSTRELAAILRGLRGVPIVGLDIVEVSPPYDHAEVTAIAAANLVYDLLGLMTT